LRNAIDFVTRRWIKCPVETREDWEDMKRRYDPDDKSRFPADAKALGERLADREHIVHLGFSGPFWQLREWLGFENLCMLFHDDPEFVKEMIGFWRVYMERLLERLFRFVVPDMITISEDMAFKSFPMISPEMTREFLLPVYQCWGEIILGGGCPVYAIDSDGFVHDLISVWMKSGVNACGPMEVAAGNDLVALREKFGHDMAFMGGVDKRAMAKGGQTLEAAIHRLEPVIRDGGYIPSCDHGVPSDVSWSNYVNHVQLLARATGWL
jgi:uroporphyrinogen decarboxylase